MGEISAKHLRGDSMADVIFNGSSARKPVGTASVELVFDNSDGKIGGQLRQLRRNLAAPPGRRATARPTTFSTARAAAARTSPTLFLGTGLGPRSYAIIEQGMISRVIEAKAEDMRAFLEEAAGISRYKERRRETETRIRHTRENLERLNDLRDEVDKQLRELAAPGQGARQFQGAARTERRARAELSTLRYQATRTTKAPASARCWPNRKTGWRRWSPNCARSRRRWRPAARNTTTRRRCSTAVQGRFYELGAEVARTEQAIQHAQGDPAQSAGRAGEDRAGVERSAGAHQGRRRAAGVPGARTGGKRAGAGQRDGRGQRFARAARTGRGRDARLADGLGHLQPAQQ